MYPRTPVELYIDNEEIMFAANFSCEDDITGIMEGYRIMISYGPRNGTYLVKLAPMDLAERSDRFSSLQLSPGLPRRLRDCAARRGSEAKSRIAVLSDERQEESSS